MVREADGLVGCGFGPQVVCNAEDGEDELGLAFDAEFAADVVNVGPGGIRGYAAGFGDALIVVAIEDVFGDVELAFGQGSDAFDEFPMFCVHQHEGDYSGRKSNIKYQKVKIYILDIRCKTLGLVTDSRL